MPATLEAPPKAKTAGPHIVAPFTVQADHPRNCDLLIQAIPGCRLRGAVSASKGVVDAKTGDVMVPQDQSRHLGMLPALPGMELSVNPADCTYIIRDPLHGDEELLARLKRTLDAHSPFRTAATFNGVKPQKGTLDIHRMKTLVRELRNLVEAGHAKVTKGPCPEEDQIEALPGKFLLNPGSRVPNTQPQFEEDYGAWVEKMNSLGG